MVSFCLMLMKKGKSQWERRAASASEGSTQTKASSGGVSSASFFWGQRPPSRLNIDMQMRPNNWKHALAHREIKIKISCSESMTLQRRLITSRPRRKAFSRNTKHGLTDKKRKKEKTRPGWSRWSRLGTERKRKRDEGTASEIHLYYVIKGEGEAGQPATDGVMQWELSGGSILSNWPQLGPTHPFPGSQRVPNCCSRLGPDRITAVSEGH